MLLTPTEEHFAQVMQNTLLLTATKDMFLLLLDTILLTPTEVC